MASAEDDHGSTDAEPMPISSFQPLGKPGRAVQIASNYLGRPGVPVITTWIDPGRVAFTSIDAGNQATTQSPPPWG